MSGSVAKYKPNFTLQGKIPFLIFSLRQYFYILKPIKEIEKETRVNNNFLTAKPILWTN